VKQCSDCEVAKPLDKFYKNRRLAYGVDNLCKQCRSIQNAKYYAANSALIRKRSAEWIVANRKRKRQTDADYAERHAHRLKEYRAVWRRNNREQQRQWQTEYYKQNPTRRAACLMRAAARRAEITNKISLPALEAKWKHWNASCWVCGEPGEAWDHVKPLAAGGAHMLCNLRPICTLCNLRKRDKWPAPSRAKILGFIV
jgi:5-methylcytosine-specific restriction endonuclease McrA